MSIELELSVADYTAILNWYELAFAKSKQQNEQDGKTLKKSISYGYDENR